MLGDFISIQLVQSSAQDKVTPKICDSLLAYSTELSIGISIIYVRCARMHAIVMA